MSKLSIHELVHEGFKLCDELGDIALLKPIVTELRVKEVFPDTTAAAALPESESNEFESFSSLVRLFALEGNPAKPLDSIFNLSTEVPNFKKTKINLKKYKDNSCIIYEFLNHNKNLNKLQCSINRKKNKTGSKPSRTNLLFEALNFSREKHMLGNKLEYIKGDGGGGGGGGRGGGRGGGGGEGGEGLAPLVAAAVSAPLSPEETEARAQQIMKKPAHSLSKEDIFPHKTKSCDFVLKSGFFNCGELELELELLIF